MIEAPEMMVNRLELPPGYSAEVEIDDPYKNVTPGPIPWHEALHVVPAWLKRIPIILASRKAGRGYLGITITGWGDKEVAIGPHAHGFVDGSSSDVEKANAMGDAGSAGSAVRSRLAGKWDLVKLVASLIEVKESVNGAQIDEAIDSYLNPITTIKLTARNGSRWDVVGRLNQGLDNIVNSIIPPRLELAAQPV